MLASRHVLREGAKWLLFAGVFSYSTWSMALGLGEITVHSALNQPFKADIALVDVGTLTQNDLSASLASADEFGRAGVERVFFLNDLRFTPILRGKRQMIRVTSRKPVSEPFLNFLVQLEQPNGRLLREYTVLIDPPGSPGIVPATDEPDPPAQSSGFPAVEPATAKPQAAQGKREAAPASPPSATTPVNDGLAEQLAASVLLNQQLQKTVDEQNARLQAQEAQIADGRKQVSDLQTRLAQLQQPPPAPVAPPIASPPALAPAAEPEGGVNWPLLAGLLLALGALGALFVQRRRQQAEQTGEPLTLLPQGPEPDADPVDAAAPVTANVTPDPREEPGAGDVLEAVGIYLAYGRLGEAAGLLRDALQKEPERIDLGLQLLEVYGRQGDSAAYDQQEGRLRERGVEDRQLQEARGRHAKLVSTAALAPVVALAPDGGSVPTAPEDDFELNLGELSMDANWDLEASKETSVPPVADENVSLSDLQVLPEGFDLGELASKDDVELEWFSEPDAQPLDDDFLNEFDDSQRPLMGEPAAGSEKLEQAQTCIDDGDIDSAIALLTELLKEGDEPLKQTARTLLAGIR